MLHSDRIAPLISSPALSSTNAVSTVAKFGDSLLLTFTVSDSTVPVMLFNTDIQPTSLTHGSENAWTASLSVTNTVPAEGAVSYTVSLVDGAGNSRTCTTCGSGDVRVGRFTAVRIDSASMSM